LLGSGREEAGSGLGGADGEGEPARGQSSRARSGPGKGNSNAHGARPVHLIIMMIKWIWTSRLSIKNSLSRSRSGREKAGSGLGGAGFEGQPARGANGSKSRPHDPYPVRCRVHGYYETCSERVRVCQLKKWRQLKKLPPPLLGSGREKASGGLGGADAEGQPAGSHARWHPAEARTGPRRAQENGAPPPLARTRNYFAEM